MSRIAAASCLAFFTCALPANAQTAEQAIAQSRSLTGVDADGCARQRDASAIIVCGSNLESRRQRLPYRDPSDAGAPPPRGEVRAASAAPIRQGSCGALVADKCGGGFSLLALIPFAAKLVAKAIDPESGDPPTPIPTPR